MRDILDLVAAELREFLGETLPSVSPEWWSQHVVGRLTFQQQRAVTERDYRDLKDLDLAALLRVFDQNWFELTQRVTLPREARSWVRELQTVRNKWAHAGGNATAPSETYRDLDTAERLLAALGRPNPALIEARKAEMLRLLAPAARDTTPAVAADATTFSAGALVALRSDPNCIVPILAAEPSANAETRYRVFLNGAPATFYESQLRPVDHAPEQLPILDAAELRAVLTALHLAPPSSHQLYSLRSGRINFVPYQYRPVMKLIRSDRPRILVADEVGVGKTIEAGLILKELGARMDLASVLVICPKALVTEQKWYREMKRFDEHFVALDGASLRYCIDETDHDGSWPTQYARSILPMSLLDWELLDGVSGRRRRIGLRQLEPPPKFDLVIVDEAHNIRNADTATHHAVRYFCDNAQAVVFLTATPLQLGTPDYFTLLNVLRPDLVRDAASFELMAAPNGFLNEAVSVCRAAGAGWQEQARTLLESAASTEWGRMFLRERPEFQAAYDDLGDPSITTAVRVSLIRRIEELGSFSSLINRTRRRDIGSFTTRKPETVTIEFSPEQRVFHDDLLGVIARLLAARHGDQNVKFLMTTIRRQAASCLFGLAPLLDGILRRNLDRLELLEVTDDDGEIDLEFVAGLERDLVSLRERARSLSPSDPKADAFVTAIKAKQERPNNKVLVFSTFRHTLSYLEAQLRPLGLRVGVVHGDVVDEDRADIRRRFALDRAHKDAVDVLLSSEVGSEGLDVQFCDYLINYDLPWNPMRIEQRIGRLDRYGQQSESIAIVNFVTPGTVDAEIYERCLLRIGIFHHAIGASEAILGSITRQLHEIGERFDLTPSERAEKLQQMSDNEIRRLQAQEELEQEQAHFFGLDLARSDADELAAADSPWLSPKAIEHLVRNYLAVRIGTHHGVLLGESELKTLRLAQESRLTLLGDFGKLPRTVDTSRQWERWLHGTTPTLAVTFGQTTAATNPSVAYLALGHPLVLQAASFLTRRDASAADLLVASSLVAPGEYRFALYRWAYRGVRPDEALVTVADDPRLEDHLLGLLAEAASRAPERAAAVSDFDALDARHHAKWAEAQANHAAQNRELVDYRVQSLTASHTARRLSIQDQLMRASNEKIVKMKESELASADADFERHLKKLRDAGEAGDIHATPLLFGTLKVTPAVTNG